MNKFISVRAVLSHLLCVRYGLIAFQSTVKGEMYGESGSLWCSVSQGASSRIW